MEKQINTIEAVVNKILIQDVETAKDMLEKSYPFTKTERDTRSYTINQKLIQFKKDGFIDRYTGAKLVNPGILKAISFYLPDSFPYHKNWKMTECHVGYWELTPTIDHVYPIALGGEDNPDNWVTTSMLNNSVKSNWTIEQLRWKIVPAGEFEKWDGLTSKLIQLVNDNPKLLEDMYIKKWYQASLKVLNLESS